MNVSRETSAPKKDTVEDAWKRLEETGLFSGYGDNVLRAAKKGFEKGWQAASREHEKGESK